MDDVIVCSAFFSPTDDVIACVQCSIQYFALLSINMAIVAVTVNAAVTYAEKT